MPDFVQCPTHVGRISSTGKYMAPNYVQHSSSTWQQQHVLWEELLPVGQEPQRIEGTTLGLLCVGPHCAPKGNHSSTEVIVGAPSWSAIDHLRLTLCYFLPRTGGSVADAGDETWECRKWLAERPVTGGLHLPWEAVIKG